MTDDELKKRAEAAIALLKAHIKNANGLVFLDDKEWFDENYAKPFFNIRSEFANYKTCLDCHQNSGSSWGTDVCPMLMPMLNIEGSNNSRVIMWQHLYCRYRLQAEAKDKGREWLSKCGLAQRFIDEFTFDRFNTSHHSSLKGVVDTCKRYVKKFPELQVKGLGLYFYSPYHRVGKSHLAIATALQILADHQIPFQYYHMFTFLRDYKIGLKDWDAGGFSEGMQWLDDLVSFPGVMVLDDFGKENTTKSTLDLVYSMVSHRVENKLPTIYTSNYNIVKPEDFDASATSLNANRLSDKYTGVVGTDILYKIASVSKVLDMSDVPSMKGDVDF